MPARRQNPEAVDLASVVPTDAELAHAKSVIEAARDPTKAIASKMSCLKHWLSSTPGAAAQNPDFFSARASEREQFMTQFLVLQARDKKAKMDKTVGKWATNQKLQHETTGWKSYEWLVREEGKAKADFLIDSKALPVRPCSRTGSTKKEFAEYWYDRCETVRTMGGGHKAEVEHKTDGDEAALTFVESLMPEGMMGEPSSSAAGLAGPRPETHGAPAFEPVKVKIEQEAEDILITIIKN